MTDGYNIQPAAPPPDPAAQVTPAPSDAPAASSSSPPLKPGDPGWIPPTVIVEKAASEESDPSIDPDVEKNRGIAVLGYVCFLVPLVLAPNSKFARFHANQGLLAFITLCVAVVAVIILYFVGNLVGKATSTITILYYFFACIFNILQPALLLAWVALVIYGIIQAANGEKKGLPVVGHWTLIK